MDSLKIKIDAGYAVNKKLAYIWDVFAVNAGIGYLPVEVDQDILISDTPEADIPVSGIFLENITEGVYHHQRYFDKEPLLYNESGQPDYLGTCFYMLNCLQEYNVFINDKIGRFPFEDSFQCKFNCAEENLVAKYFSKLLKSYPLLEKHAVKQSTRSRYFLSHDNDVLHGSFLQDGLYAIKHGRVDVVLRLIFNEILKNPAWRNMSGIMDIEDEYDVKSTFFWLVNRGIHEGVNNADYDINSKAIREIILNIERRGWGNGLHKSTSEESYLQEMDKLGFKALANRNHFLKIGLPRSFDQIDKSGLKLDCSLGFAEKIGFRNCYALPFRPYDIKRDKPYDFIEICLHVMDATLYNYEKIPTTQGMKKVLEFLDKHKDNSLISILWHNKYFTGYKYKGYLEIYKAILDFMAQNHILSATPEDMIKQYLKI